MNTFIKIAWRNITRNKHRSTITIVAVAIGLCSLIFLKGFVDGSDNQMVANYTDLLIGHIQIHKMGFQKNMDLELSFRPTKHLTGLLSGASQIIKSYAPRVKNFCLISSTEGSSGILLMGIDPELEKKTTTLHERILKGRFLEAGDHEKIVIGKDLAANLKVSLGDKVVIMSQGADGSLAAAAYQVAGLLDAGAEEINKSLALVTLPAAQELLVLDDKISEIALQTVSLERVDEIQDLLKKRLASDPLEILTWKEISPMTYQWLQFDQVFTNLILLIVLLVVASGILNTVLMGVLERTREFGIMMALGTKPGQIIFMVVAESILLGSIGVILGGSFGIGLLAFFAVKGIDLSVISSALNSFYIGSVIHTQLNLYNVGLYSLVVLCVSIAISILPATKASKLRPIEAIRQP